MGRVKRRLMWLAYGLAPRWLAAIMALFWILGEATEASERAAAAAGDEYQLRTCANCGDELNDVEWLFDPCPASEEGDHREAATVTADDADLIRWGSDGGPEPPATWRANSPVQAAAVAPSSSLAPATASAPTYGEPR